MPIRNRAWYLILIALPLAIAIRVEMIGLNGLAHDEVLSIIFAQGNAGRYETTKQQLAGRWVPASAWKSYFSTPSDGGYALIEKDLSEHNDYPPLYFWLLHQWLKVFGPAGARWMNFPFFIATAVALFAFATSYLGDTGGALATSIWLFSPETIRITAITRSFEMLALIAVLIAFQTSRIIQGRTSYRNIAALGVLALVGMLTQYLAAFVVLTAIGLIALRRRDALGPTLVAMVIAAVLFVLLHPGFYLQFSSSHETVMGLTGRIKEAASTLLGFFGWRRPWTMPVMGYVVVSIAVIGGAIYTVRYWPIPIPVAFIIFPLALSLGAFLATLTPSYAFLGRHLGFIWPFVATALSMGVLKFAPKAAPFALAGIVLLAGPVEFFVLHNRSAPPSIIETAPQIVLNNLSIGILPRYLHEARDSAMVFAEKDLSADMRWRDALKPGALVIINPQYQDPGDVKRSIAAVHGLKFVSHLWTTTIYRR